MCSKVLRDWKLNEPLRISLFGGEARKIVLCVDCKRFSRLLVAIPFLDSHPPNEEMQSFHISTLALLSSLVTFVRACVDETIVSMEGIAYLIYCGNDWPGNDLNHLPNVNNFTDCINLCDLRNTVTTDQPITSFCVGVSLAVDPSTDIFYGCWLKASMEGSGLVQDNASVYLVDSARRTVITTVRLPRYLSLHRLRLVSPVPVPRIPPQHSQPYPSPLISDFPQAKSVELWVE